VSRAVRLSTFVAAVAALLAIASCRGPAQSYTSLGAHALALRGQFNRDAGHARIVILPAPN
jgi:hypothetical protein